MTKISGKNILVIFLYVAGGLQLMGGLLALVRFNVMRPQQFVLGVIFLTVAIVLQKPAK